MNAFLSDHPKLAHYLNACPDRVPLLMGNAFRKMDWVDDATPGSISPAGVNIVSRLLSVGHRNCRTFLGLPCFAQIGIHVSKRYNLSGGWRTQYQVVHALFTRELMVRYGRENIGFAWAILEPMILTCGVMVIWSVMGGHNKDGVKAVELVFTGYMPLTLWRHLTGPVINMFRSNAALLYHHRITLLDMVIARQLVEFSGTTAALVVIYSTLFLFGMVDGVADYALIFLAWMMMGWIGTASGAILAAVTERYEVAERFVVPFQYLNIPISGAFFMVDWLPPWAQRAISWHPLVHVYEVFRSGYFGSTVVTHYDLVYFATCSFVLSYLGLRAVQRIRPYVRLQ